jgi:hypothetical protein
MRVKVWIDEGNLIVRVEAWDENGDLEYDQDIIPCVDIVRAAFAPLTPAVRRALLAQEGGE